MATVSIVQSTTFSSASTTTGTVTLGSTPASGDYIVLAIAAGNAIMGLSNPGFALLGGSPGNPVLQLYAVKADGIINSMTVTLTGAAHLAIYYFELSSACKSLVSTTAGSTTTAPSLSANTPPTWLTTVGDLPLAFFTAQPASTATAQSGWTNLTTLNAANGSVLNAQSGPTATSAGQSYTGMVTWGTANPAGEVFLLSANQSFYDFTSQEVLETLAQDTAADRSSQMHTDVLSQGVPTARGSQEFAELVSQDTAFERTSQIFIELLVPLYLRVSQDVLEPLAQDTAHVRTSQEVLEVLFSSQGQRRRTIDEEWTTI